MPVHRYRQVHIWITESDYRLLRDRAEQSRESFSAAVRRVMRAERTRLQDAGLIRQAPPLLGEMPDVPRSMMS